MLPTLLRRRRVAKVYALVLMRRYAIGIEKPYVRPPTLSPSLWRLIDWNRFVIALEIARYNLFTFAREENRTRLPRSVIYIFPTIFSLVGKSILRAVKRILYKVKRWLLYRRDAFAEKREEGTRAKRDGQVGSEGGRNG